MEPFRERLLQIWGPDPSDPSQALAWIEGTVNEVGEDGYLDFKRKTNEATPVPDEADKGHLARCMSGFANTDGGLIVWGVYAHGGGKDEADVARELRPIRGLKTFVSKLNSACGQAVSPPLTGVENRAVPSRDAQDTGYVITVVPRRRESLTQAEMGREYKGRFFLRSGSGFFAVPQSLLAEFFSRRPMPQLELRLELGGPSETEIEEDLLSAERWVRTSPHVEEPSGRCEYRQYLKIPWKLFLRNQGGGSAAEVAGSLAVIGSGEMEGKQLRPVDQLHVSVTHPVRRSPEAKAASWQPVYGAADGVMQIKGKIHPGQEIRIAKGHILVPQSAFDGRADDLQIEGIFYATDCPPFKVEASVDGGDISSTFAAAFNEKALAPIRQSEARHWLGDE